MPEHTAVTAQLVEEVDAEARLFAHGIGEIEIEILFETLPAILAADLAHDRGQAIVFEDRLTFNRAEVPVNPPHGWRTGTQVQVAAYPPEHGPQPVIDLSHDTLQI